MKAPEFIKNSGDLGDAAGYVDVNPFTLQHKRYANIWGLGKKSIFDFTASQAKFDTF